MKFGNQIPKNGLRFAASAMSIRAVGCCVGVVLLVGIVLVTPGAAATCTLPTPVKPPTPTSPTVLMLENTITPQNFGSPTGTGSEINFAGDCSSLEAQQAMAPPLNLNVVIVNDAAWGSMTQSDFASYSAIVLGDPGCARDTTPITAAQNNSGTWGPAITGPVAIIGTDPEFHFNAGVPIATAQLTQNAIAFASLTAGKTGAYISLSCYYENAAPATAVPVLSPFGSFTVQRTQWDVSTVVASGNALVNTPHVLHDADLSNWGVSSHEGFNSYPPTFTAVVNTQQNVESTPVLPYILSTPSSGWNGSTQSGPIVPVSAGTTSVLLPPGSTLSQSITIPQGTNMNGIDNMQDTLTLVDGATCDATVANGNPGDPATFGGSPVPGPLQGAHPFCVRLSGNQAAIITNHCFIGAVEQTNCTGITPPQGNFISLTSQWGGTDPKNPAYVIAHDDASHLIGGIPGPDWTNITAYFSPGCCIGGGHGITLNGQETIIDLNFDTQPITFGITPNPATRSRLVTVAGKIQGVPAVTGSSTNGFGLLTFTFEGPAKNRSGVCTQSKLSIPPPPVPGGPATGFPVRLAAANFSQSFSFNLFVPSSFCPGNFIFSTTLQSGNITYNNSVPLTIK